MKDIEKIYAQTFNTGNGQRVLEHLRRMTIERVLGPDATDAELRALEGQRMLVHIIEQMIKRGTQDG